MYTFATPLERALRTNPDAIATYCEGRVQTYAQFARRCRKLGGALRALGLKPGERVGMVGPNSERYFELYFSVPASGFVFVPVNWRLAGPEMTAVLEDAGVKVLFLDGDYPVPDSVEHVIRMPQDYHEFVKGGEEIALGEGVHEDDLAVLFYTSGTTGVGKGAMHTHRSLLASTMHFLATWPYDADSKWMVCSPMFHTGGTLAIMAVVWAGGSHVILPQFDPETACDLIEQQKVTHTLMVPTMLSAASKSQRANPRNVSSLKYLSHGASPISVETLRATRNAFPDAELLHVYGTTETTPCTLFLKHEEDLIETPLVKSCGQPAIGVEVLIVDMSTGEEAPTGTVGELWTRTPSTMKGYWNKPEETAAVLVEGGWYRTGDLGYVDAASHVFLVDRAKDMIVTGGENVYSVEVEVALASHPAVDEVAAFGIPDSKWGEAVYAVVMATSDITAEELIAHCKSQIAGYKVPKQIEVWYSPLPKSAAGKILKRNLRDPHWANQQSSVAGS
ncbi:MAG: AMP-binding protein [Austwickia sp.]|jgi:long-chain acyl-CoA synthetase|nr:MAG: AMP-binding protein [Austwickia sp.]